MERLFPQLHIQLKIDRNAGCTEPEKNRTTVYYIGLTNIKICIIVPCETDILMPNLYRCMAILDFFGVLQGTYAQTDLFGLLCLLVHSAVQLGRDFYQRKGLSQGFSMMLSFSVQPIVWSLVFFGPYCGPTWSDFNGTFARVKGCPRAFQ